MRFRHAALLAPLLALPATGPAGAAPDYGTWHAKQARITPEAHGAGRNGMGVTVAVIDTWVDGSHSNFQGRVLPGVDCVGGCEAGVEADQCEHGTHVAGTVASLDFGVAPGAKILPLRILKWNGSQCTGNTTDAAAAIRYAVSRGAKVVNLSVGGDTPLVGSTTEIPAAVSEAAGKGVLVVFAAGNDGSPASDTYGDDALIVAATGPDGRIASYSRTGPFISFAAPGGDPVDGKNCRPDGSDCVASTYPGNSYAAAAGTSMAAPHVAGLAAMLYAQGRNRQQVIDRMRATARPLSGAGAGLIDVAAAVGAKPATAKPTTPAPRKTTTRRPTVRPAATIPAQPVRTPSRVPGPAATRPPTPSAEPSELPTPDTLALPREDSPREDRTVPAAAAALLAAIAGAGVAATRRSR